MKILLDDITGSDNLYPFTATRSMVDIRLGILTIREKWEHMLDEKIHTISELKDLPKDAIVLPGNIIPHPELIKSLKEKNSLIQNFEEDILQYSWQISSNNDKQIRQDFLLLAKDRASETIPAGVTAISPENIFIEPGAKVQYCILNASTGPIYIGKNSEIMEGCLVRGPMALCEGSILKMGTKVYGATTAGPYSVLGGEIKNSVLFGFSNKGHDGYLGDSVIGEWCNLGAGTSNSNVKNTGGDIRVWHNAKSTYIKAGNKCGLLMGDYSRAAINTSFNTGTVVGVCCNVFAERFPPKYLPDFSWAMERYDLDKAFLDINNWKQLKGHKITSEEKKILSDLYKKRT